MFQTEQDVRDRLYASYPQAVIEIKDIQAILNTLIPEFYNCDVGLQNVLANTTLLTMGEDRIKEWEKLLGISPIKNSTLQDRRDVIIARLKGLGKLNTTTIDNMVKQFTGGTCISYFEDSTLFVEITPPQGDKSYIFKNVEQEIGRRVPAHISFRISRNYYEWGEIYEQEGTWENLNTHYETWEDVCLYSPFQTQKA